MSKSVNETLQLTSPPGPGESADGLPVLITLQIGNDSLIIEKERVGAVFTNDRRDLRSSFSIIKFKLKQEYQRSRIAAIVFKYRSFDREKNAYSYFLGDSR